MKLYIIDTARPAFWLDLQRNDLCFVCDENENTEWSLNTNAVVFAHSHRVYQDEHPDLVLNTLDDNSPVVQNFCRALVAASNNGCHPMIVLYSGGDCEQSWKSIATAEGGPLHGFLANRIEPYLQTIHRQNCTEELRAMVEAVNSQLEGAEGGVPINLDTSWLEEVKLAARLLVEAADAVTDEFNGIRIARPPADLANLARQVIEASDRQQNIIPSANALCEKLGSLRSTQP